MAKTEQLTKGDRAAMMREAILELRELLAATPTIGETKYIYSSLKHASKGGTTFEYAFYLVTKDGYLRSLSHLMAHALGWKLGRHGGIKLTTCGTRLDFWAVYQTMFAIGLTDGSNQDWQKLYYIASI
jgi:hypothetical protein